jgi:hypothetical protein
MDQRVISNAAAIERHTEQLDRLTEATTKLTIMIDERTEKVKGIR